MSKATAKASHQLALRFSLCVNNNSFQSRLWNQKNDHFFFIINKNPNHSWLVFVTFSLIVLELEEKKNRTLKERLFSVTFYCILFYYYCTGLTNTIVAQFQSHRILNSLYLQAFFYKSIDSQNSKVSSLELNIDCKLQSFFW